MPIHLSSLIFRLLPAVCLGCAIAFAVPARAADTAAAKTSVADGNAASPGSHERPDATSPGASERPDEDWTTLDLSRTHLHPKKPVESETDDAPTYTRHLVRLAWRPFDPIDVYIVKPKNVDHPPVVLCLYGYPSETARFQDDSYCRSVTRYGCAAVGFVSALTGSRYRFRPMREWFVSELQESLACSTHDIPLILDYLTKRGDLDMNRVGMFGQGSGATIAVLAASVEPRIKAIDLLNPWGDWPDWMAKSTLVPGQERPNYVKDAFLAKVRNFDPVAVLPTLTHTSVRLRQIEEDTITPPEARKAVAAAMPKGGVVEQYKTNNEFRGVAAGGQLFAWTAERLAARKAASSR